MRETKRQEPRTTTGKGRTKDEGPSDQGPLRQLLLTHALERADAVPHRPHPDGQAQRSGGQETEQHQESLNDGQRNAANLTEIRTAQRRSPSRSPPSPGSRTRRRF